MKMEISIGGDCGIKVTKVGSIIEVSPLGEGLLSIDEARAAAEALILLADTIRDEEDRHGD